MKYSRYILVIFLVVFVLFIFVGKSQKLNRETLLSEFGTCQSSDDNLACMKNLADSWLNKYSVDDIAKTISEASNDDRVRDCHRFGHFVGNRLFNESKTLKDSLGACSDFCFSACYHGVAEEMFGQTLRSKGVVEKSDFIEDLRDFNQYCGSLDSSLQNSCYADFGSALHGLGHAFMFVTENELPEALKLCDLAGAEFSLEASCYDGVFMSNNEALNDMDHSSKYIRADDIIFPCNILDYKYQEICYKSKADYFLKDSSDKNIETCKRFPAEFQSYCFEQSARMISTVSFAPEGLKEGCDLVPSEQRGLCIHGLMVLITGKFPKTNQVALDFCNAYSDSYRNVCLDHLGEQIDSRQWGNVLKRETCILIDNPKPNWCNNMLK